MKNYYASYPDKRIFDYCSSVSELKDKMQNEKG